MRRFTGYCLMLMIVFLASPALGGLDTTHHDIPNYAAAAVTKDKCFFCHGIKDTNSAATLRPTFGDVGAFCVTRCHSGEATSLLGALGAVEPEAPASNGGTGDTWSRGGADYLIVGLDTSVQVKSGHQRVIARTAADGSAAAAGTAASGFPYTGGGSLNLECTSCHSVHDAANTPFVWLPLQPGAQGGLCEKCHTLRSTNTLDADPDGNHPVNFVYSEADALARSTTSPNNRSGNFPARHNRTISIDWSGSVFDVAVPAVLQTQAQNYPTGGHLGGLATKATTSQQMGCYTCHSAHQPGDVQNNLVLVDYMDKPNGWNPICTGCHGSASTWATNPTDNSVGGNGTAYYGHPYGSDTDAATLGATSTYNVSVGGFSFTLPTAVVDAANTQYGIEFGAQGEVMCSSCHDVHLGQANSLAIADLGQGATEAVCNACHDGSELADIQDLGEAGAGEGANVHHRTRAAAVAASDNPPNDANDLAINLSWVTVQWWTMGDLTDGLQCADCHQFNGTAHNWP